MSDEFVLAVHTKTHLLQRVPPHYIDCFPYFKLAKPEQIAEAQGVPVEKPKTEKGAK